MALLGCLQVGLLLLQGQLAVIVFSLGLQLLQSAHIPEVRCLQYNESGDKAHVEEGKDSIVVVHVELVAEIDVERLFDRLIGRDERGDLSICDAESLKVGEESLVVEAGCLKAHDYLDSLDSLDSDHLVAG